MPKRLIDLDDELLEAARAALSTKGVTDTVRGALQEAVATQARLRQVAWLEDGGMSELHDRELREAVWR